MKLTIKYWIIIFVYVLTYVNYPVTLFHVAIWNYSINNPLANVTVIPLQMSENKDDDTVAANADLQALGDILFPDTGDDFNAGAMASLPHNMLPG